MKNNTKTIYGIFGVILLGIISFLGGCQFDKLTNTNLNDQDFHNLLLVNDSQVKFTTYISTKVYLETIQNKEDRLETAKLIKDISDKINKAVLSGNSASNILALTVDLTNTVDPKYREAVSTLINAVVITVQNDLSVKLKDFDKSRQAEITKETLLSATDGVSAACDTQILPTTQP